LREEEVSLHEVTGLLAEASLVRHTFGVSSDGRIIKGKVPAQLADAVQKAFGHQVVATYEERRVRDDVTQEERRSVSLLDVRTA
jgi:peptidyl-tRNA hydrolase